ncbi:MAG: cation diffusion facilitator family transporter [Sphingomonadaceae bacterium]
MALPVMPHAHGPGAHHAHEAHKLPRRAASLALALALAMLAAKAWAAWMTGAFSVVGTLADSALDVLASLITLGGTLWARRPADEDHRFGHGKAEALAALAQGLLLLVAAFLLAVASANRLANPEPVVMPWAGIAAAAFCIAGTAGLLAYQRHVIARTGSIAIKADRLHYAGDIALNASVILALGLGMTLGWQRADPIFAIAIAAWLARSGVVVGRHAIDVLMDRSWPDEDLDRLRHVAAGVEGVEGVHEIRTRGAGLHRHATLHIWVDPALSLGVAHEVADSVEAAVRAAFPGVGVLVHVDPTGHRDLRPPQG